MEMFAIYSGCSDGRADEVKCRVWSVSGSSERLPYDETPKPTMPSKTNHFGQITHECRFICFSGITKTFTWNEAYGTCCKS